MAVVNKTFVDTYLKGKPPIGEHFGTDSALTGEYQIVGVVEDIRFGDITEPTRPMFFTPMTQVTTYDAINATPSMREQATRNEQFEHFASNLIIRYQGDSASAARTVRATLPSIDPNIPILRLLTYSDQVSNYFIQQELAVRLTTIFGALALVLASIGLYGVTAYGVARRVPEIGVRMALGANRLSVLVMILRGAMLQVMVGLAIGIPCALLAGHFLQSQLYGASGYSAVTLLTACAALMLSALLAGIVPAQRASAVEPMQALRAE